MTPCPDLEPTPTATREARESKQRRQARWEAITVSLATLLVVAAGSFGLWVTSTRTIRENFRHHLIELAQAAALQVDPSLHGAIRRPEQLNDPDYARAVAPLRALRHAIADIHYIYTVVRDGEAVRFVLDAADPGHAAAGGSVNDQSGVWESYPERDPAMLTALGDQAHTGHAEATERPYADQWGIFMTGWAPLIDRNGAQIGAIGVDVDAGVYVARLRRARNAALTGLAPAGLLIMVLGTAFYRIRLRALRDAASAIDTARQAQKTAQALAHERGRLSRVIEALNLGTWERRLSADATLVNEHFGAMLGYRAEELAPLTDRRFFARIHPEDRASVQAKLAALTRSPDSAFDSEFRLRHRCGHWVWIQARGTVVERDAEGSPLRIAGINVDISERKRIELALQESEAQLRSLFELSPVGIAMNDLNTGQFLQANDALIAPTGYSRAEILSMTYWDLTPATYNQEESAQLESLRTTNRYGPYEKLYRRKDGTTYSVLLSGLKHRDASGRDVIWSIVQDISHRKAMESQLAEAAQRDRLTGLANRALFMERLQRAVDRARSPERAMFAVMFLDFDRFKLINDTLGHSAGDEVLRQCAARLTSALRGGDSLSENPDGNLVSRFGGDEFLILIGNVTSDAAASRVAERILNALAPSYQIFGSEVHLTASIGIVTSDQCSGSAEDIVRNADVAMYEAKHSGRACSVVFNEAMHTRLARHVAIETSLRRAIGTHETRLVFQPIVDLQSGELVSAEALIRWKHPTLGDISPTEFIPVAEDSGLIVALGQWVLQEACASLVHWRRTAPEQAPRTVSVNISRAELALGAQLLESVERILAQTALPAACLQIEVTEREVMRNPAAALGVLRELKRLGVQLAMDDFGTGTSSLACLRDYPFDIVKIDRSFLRDLTASPDGMALVHATITLVENLGMSSVAEGVEQPEQLAVLQALGCRCAQGFLFSPPVDRDSLLAAVAGWQRINQSPEPA